jgi:signal transduction histidine kinase
MFLLIIVLAVENDRRAGEARSTILAINESHRRTGDLLRDVESGIYLSGLLVRDFLLDYSPAAAPEYRRQLLDLRAAMDSSLTALDSMGNLKQRAPLAGLRRETDGYWESLDPVFEWTLAQKAIYSTAFLRTQVLPRRLAMLEMAKTIEVLAAADVKERQDRLAENLASFRAKGLWRLALVVLLAAAVAAASLIRISRLEKRAEQQRLSTEQAEKELRRLSQKLVHAQEEESRRLSRELHDEVGQMLTALRVELGNLETLRSGPDEEFDTHLSDAKILASSTLNSVRNLAAGLRPSVLDDFGLGPALQWQAREFSRRTGVPVEVVFEESPMKLPDAHSTCVYRVVQEALTNCARHAAASEIRIALHVEPNRLDLTIQDDGKGMPSLPSNGYQPASSGLGLISMEERVGELAGTLEIHSQPGKGTLIKVSIPVPAEVLS